MIARQQAETRKQKGAMAVLAGFAVVGMLAFAAVVADVGYMMVTKTELQNVADVSADSAILELSRIYDGLGKTNPDTYTLTATDKARVLDAINRIANQNTVAGMPVDVIPDDIIYGRWEYANGGMSNNIIFTQTETGPTAISVRARRDESANGVVDTLMSSFLGVNDFRATAEASAALTPLSVLPEGRIELPVGISESWFQTRRDSGLPPCGEQADLQFYPIDDWSGCVGWQAFDTWPADAAGLESIVRGIADGTYLSPEVRVGETELEFLDLSAYDEVDECCEHDDAGDEGDSGGDSDGGDHGDSDGGHHGDSDGSDHGDSDGGHHGYSHSGHHGDSDSGDDGDSDSDAGGGEKVRVCHIPPGNPGNQNVISVDASAVQAHVDNHGDYLGDCECQEHSSRTVLRAIRDLYEQRKDEDGEWRVQVPVYRSNDCSVPEGQQLVVGIATLLVTNVELPVVCCDDDEEGGEDGGGCCDHDSEGGCDHHGDSEGDSDSGDDGDSDDDRADSKANSHHGGDDDDDDDSEGDSGGDSDDDGDSEGDSDSDSGDEGDSSESSEQEAVCEPSEGSIEAKVACCVLQYGEGGGPDFGTRLAFPLTVE